MFCCLYDGAVGRGSLFRLQTLCIRVSLQFLWVKYTRIRIRHDKQRVNKAGRNNKSRLSWCRVLYDGVLHVPDVLFKISTRSVFIHMSRMPMVGGVSRSSPCTSEWRTLDKRVFRHMGWHRPARKSQCLKYWSVLWRMCSLTRSCLPELVIPTVLWFWVVVPLSKGPQVHKGSWSLKCVN